MERVRHSGQPAVSESDRHVEQQDTRNSRQGLPSRATRGASHTRLQRAVAGPGEEPSESVLQFRLPSGAASDRRFRGWSTQEPGVDASRYLRQQVLRVFCSLIFVWFSLSLEKKNM